MQPDAGREAASAVRAHSRTVRLSDGRARDGAWAALRVFICLYRNTAPLVTSRSVAAQVRKPTSTMLLS